jgi:hypothetical protein
MGRIKVLVCRPVTVSINCSTLGQDGNDYPRDGDIVGREETAVFSMTPFRKQAGPIYP